MPDPITQPEPTTPPAGTFTQEQVNALLAAEKRKATEKFADYDDVKAKAGKLDEIEKAAKTDLEREREARNSAEAAVAKYQAKEQATTWSADIVKGSTIPAHVLRGTTREELEAHFNELKELAPKPQRTTVPPGKPAGEGTGSRAVAALRELRGGSN